MQKHSASTCRWACPTLYLGTPIWLLGVGRILDLSSVVSRRACSARPSHARHARDGKLPPKRRIAGETMCVIPGQAADAGSDSGRHSSPFTICTCR